MRVGALAVALEGAGLDVLLGVVERAAGVAHEDRARDGHDGRADEQTADEVRRDRRQMYELCQAGHQQTDDQSDAQTNQGFFHFLNTYLSSRYACGHTGKCRSPPLHLSIVFPVIGKKQNSKKFYNKFTNMSIFLGTMFPRKKAFFPVVLLNMVSREVKPVEGIKFCSSFFKSLSGSKGETPLPPQKLGR